MSFFDPISFDLLPAVGISIFENYMVALALHFFTLCVLTYQWKTLPTVFRNCAAITVSILFIGFLISTFYLTTLHTIDECNVGRKIIYFLVYAGFVAFDVVISTIILVSMFQNLLLS